MAWAGWAALVHPLVVIMAVEWEWVAWVAWAASVHPLVVIMAVEWEWVVAMGTAEGSVVLSVVDTGDMEEDSVVDLGLVPVVAVDLEVDAAGDGGDASEWMGLPYRLRDVLPF